MSKARASQRIPKQTTSKDSAASKDPSRPLARERQSQVTLQMRQSLHRELTRKAFESDMTMRGFIMRALKKMGLNVTDADLVDRRRRDD